MAKRIVTTEGEVARHFRVSRRTVCDWKRAGMPWAPRRYSLAAIAAWRALRPGAGTNEAQAALMAVRVQRERLELAEYEGKVLRVEPVQAVVERAIAACMARLDGLSDFCVSLLPSTIPDVLKGAFTSAAERAIEDLRWDAHKAFNEWADAIERTAPAAAEQPADDAATEKPEGETYCESKAELMRVRTRRESLELAKYQGKLFSADELDPLAELTIAIVRTAILEPLQSRIETLLPDSLLAIDREHFSSRTSQAIHDLGAAFETSVNQLRTPPSITAHLR